MKACFQEFLDVILGKRANEGKGGMLEIAILILQDISNVMLGTTFLAMPPPDLFARKIAGCEGTSSGCDEHHYYYHLMLLLMLM